jgi:hypothetical protein
MTTAMKYLNNYLVNELDYKVQLGGEINYGDQDQVVRVTWLDENSLTAVSGDTYNATLQIECYTKKSSIYDHIDMAKDVKDLFSHYIVLGNGDVIEQVGEIRTAFLDLDGARKATLMIEIRKE